MGESDDHDTRDGDAVPSYPPLPVTSWAVLGMLAFGEELSGNDLKKWADWSIGFFYWSPSVSQVYGELKKLESMGLVASRTISETGVRGRRVYAATSEGMDAVRAWVRDAPVEIPVLKHGVMLRIWLGHLSDPEHLKSLVRAHIENMEQLRARAALHADHSTREPGWAFPRMSLRWALRYFEAEIELSRALFDEIDEAAEQFAAARVDGTGLLAPQVPGSWRTVEDVVSGLTRG
ncbi:PadR family transcriptional regulator [Rhodococcus rhodnii]|uniref:PadR family transcriptional regulator n=2 Tax=Rhodococcus rhodnii TaxID=38312 RepID=R7WMM7_9NOCA|nr:PadR family transcriptional regulator [Rhodococcus rhodnii]EOM76562.1 PadR family transcriptional regulator [Rhodococcus rhodnii LMG 5362]TXG92169.1 PadR family transcriptional regulator [Rhodococcus rhodnii]